MKSHKLLLLSTLLAVLPWHAASAQSREATLVAQAAPPTMPMPTADEKTAPANAIGKPVPGARMDDGKKMPSTEESDAQNKAGSSPRQDDPGADTRSQGQGKPGDKRSVPDAGKAPMPDGKSTTPGGKTGAPDNAGMPGSGASSGSGGSADPR
ncbi:MULTISPECIES: hypothetical protein [Achromobacter]|jgi:hypothetical protein|uniref:hypothetical protein n=1 Tax=Achromobacter TaxID=222 RepID=UPI0006C4971A|nr:hypothetical protein [Achromobacter kerstersii]CUI71460.1 Uncharacterised protein [Achromobacter kerstersii]